MSNAQVIQNKSEKYESLRFSANLRISKFPVAIVFPENATQLSSAIKCAARHNQEQVCIRSGGHSYEGYSTCDGLLIDLRQIKGFNYNPETQVVSASPSHTLGYIYYNLWRQYNRSIAGGSCHSVGLGGLVLGGGLGLRMRSYGLLCDSLVEIEIVTAAGHIIKANKSNNPDLLWASCGGGGGQFGAVTSICLATIPTTSEVTLVFIKWHRNKLAGLMNWFENQSSEAPNSLFLQVGLILEERAVSLTGYMTDGREEMDNFLQSSNIWAIGQEISWKIETVSFIESLLVAEPGLNRRNPEGLLKDTKPQFWKNKSAFAYRGLQNSTLLELSEKYFDNHPPLVHSILAGLVFDLLGGQVAAKRNNETAFSHRIGVLFSMQAFFYWDPTTEGATPELVEMWKTWQADVHKILMGDMRGAYRNYADVALSGFMSEYYQENQDRLQTIKQKYDPTCLFRFNQSITPL